MSQEGTNGNRDQRRSFKREIARRLDVLRLGPYDVLVLHVPREVIENPQWFDEAQQGAKEVMEVAKRGVVLLPEGTVMTAQSIEPFMRKLMAEAEEGSPALYVPPPIDIQKL